MPGKARVLVPMLREAARTGRVGAELYPDEWNDVGTVRGSKPWVDSRYRSKPGRPVLIGCRNYFEVADALTL